MKRTGEFILGMAGIILSALMTLFGFFFLWISNSEEVRSIVISEFQNDPNLNISDIDLILGFFPVAGWLVIIAALTGVIFGLIGVISVKGNKKPKLAGAMFIIGAILQGLISVGFGFLPALIFLIAGIMCLVRKPLPEQTEPLQ
ncbi:DUF4064 domain-containing protein [Pseudogracilibacillus auburnensis]|uniref:DUF4064 domain-containing protein n=1 Tax=Pseudogracilibacillus auburnensis TaxID=1494959 RepID=UPI001A965927|nr:DUF4064 domain-containing protein [Pseudogracilibacillus auburnensis]MBO1004923.1 DUF4064 domain-containing protein [Pseudogracilibacillus auburnensis]